MDIDVPTKQHLLLIDGYGFLFRAYHSLPELTRYDGTPVGAVFGFSSMLMKIMTEFEYSHIAVIFDSGVKSFRNEIYSEYKANRPAAPDDLIPQFPLVRDVVDAFNIKSVESIGFEADDVIATYSTIAKNNSLHVTIISSDKDLMQLIDGEYIKIYDPMKSRHIDREYVEEKWGVGPEKLLDLFSLIGDSSDNIPGIAGIGPKTAAELIKTYGNLDALYENISLLKQSKRKEAIIQHKNLAYLSRDLIKLKHDIVLNLSVNDLLYKEINYEILEKFFKDQGFSSLIPRIKKLHITQLGTIAIINKQDNNINYIDVLKDAKTTGKLSIHYELEKSSNILIIALASSKFSSCILKSNNIRFKEIRNSIIACFNDESIIKIFHNAKDFFKIFFQDKEILPSLYNDIEQMSYVLDAGLYKHNFTDILERNGLILQNHCDISISMLEIYDNYSQRIIYENLKSLYERIERPLINIFYDMEKIGIKIDKNKLENLSKEFTQNISEIEEQIFKESGCKFNIASPKQLADVIFGNMGIKTLEKTSSGADSTNVEVLSDLADQGHLIAKLVLKWRHFSKLNNTYTMNLVNQINKNDRISSNFNLIITSTGRISSNSPNLQNIPVRTDEGRRIRSCFIAETGYKLVSADYSQIELRLLAHIANIDTMCKALSSGHDIHSITASEIFHINQQDVTPEMRRKAKEVNFGIIYGISAFGLANRLKIDIKLAQDLIDKYFLKYPNILKYMEDTKNFAKKNGYVQTLFGRKCHLKNITDKNYSIRNFSERAAINAPLQGTAADIIKKSMINIHKVLIERNLSSKILLQVHDELLLEVPINELKEVQMLVKNKMENVVKLKVPLIVDIRSGDNWHNII